MPTTAQILGAFRRELISEGFDPEQADALVATSHTAMSNDSAGDFSVSEKHIMIDGKAFADLVNEQIKTGSHV